jgi:hypothetical protein
MVARSNKSKISMKLRRVRKKKYSRKRRSRKMKRKRRTKKKMIGGSAAGRMEPEPEPSPASSDFSKYIEGIIMNSNSTDEKIIDYLTSSKVDYTGYSSEISPPLLSRLGDIQSEDFESIGMSFLEIFYSFICL